MTIDTIAAGGDGIGAHRRRRRVRAAHGARATACACRLDTRKRFARGTLEEILTPSPERIDPLCYHYRVDKCGGCQIQHLRYDAQLDAKRGIIRDALTRIGKRAVDLPDDRAEREAMAVSPQADARDATNDATASG